CECEHNTCGDQCQVCCPGYRQKPWRPGTQETGNICEACNCHGHATDCYYDQGVADRGESLNIYSEYDGGGVCIDCLDNTMGINCEVCLDRYYRPSGVARTDPNPCRLCNCNAYGIREEPGYVLGSCVKDDSNVEEGLNPGDCFCREGYSGAHCDRCARGYKGFPDCQKCPCSIAGSVNEDVCEPPCVCKANVVGVDCDVCTPGFFNLAEDNPSGCTECFCFGITEVCVSTTLPNEQITLQDGWTITDKAFTQQMFVTTTEDDNSVLSVVYADAKRVIGSDVLYWSAPQEYLGNKLKSYGGVLTYTVGYDIIDGVNISTPILDSDVIVKGGDTTIKQRPIRWVVPGRSETFEIAFTEQTWFHEESDRYVSKVEFMSLLANLESILIRATYHTAHLDSRISDISLDIAADNVNNTNIMSSVEQCNCPSGYAGLSCEECITGYRRINGELFEGICVPCDCNGHAAECDDITGECIECQHNTYGTNCEFCVPGYYGDANVGTPGDCKRCACPLKESSNNFSPTCQEGGDTDSFYCDQCQPGYEGPRCDRCSDGYYGNPLVLNDTCKPCMFNCNNNLDVNSEGNCNSISGECLKCINNTAGAYCGRCIDGYYGDAIVEKNCQVCQCYRPGAVTEICDHRTGQCECKPHVIGQHCNICETGYWDILSAQGCNPCNCNLIGSLGVECDIIQGQCYCKPGVQGRTCDHCLSGYYNFTEDGCTLCDCERTGGSCDAQTGECICPPNTIGMRCEQCAPDTWGYDQISGCKMCNCSEDGSSGSQCNIITGQCDCLADYRGRECNQCQFGFRDFPRCRECKCNNKGTDDTGCNEDGLCGCSDEGQCECKDHVTGKRCNKCVEYSFGLREDLATGCTECFCFGITKVCQQADYVRDQIVVTAADNGFFVSDDRSIVQTQAGVVFTPDEVRLNATATLNSLDTPTTLYWNLPQIFLGNKITAYGGRLRYSVQYSGIDIGEDTVFDILIKGPQQTLVKQLLNPFVGVPQTYDLELVETEWQLRDAEKAPRDLFMMVLQNIQSIMIRATYSKDTIQSVLRDVSMEVGIPRSDNPSLSDALGVESCECPVGYIGISCEECAAGYVRVSNGPYLGSCRPCTCNEHGSMCDPNTGICEDCQDHTRGPMCETCEEGYYGNATNGTPDDCQPCACPLKESSNNFSPTCVLDNDGSHRCTDCDTGYTGRYCDSCEDGYYGNPSTLGDRCEECDCNEQGATSQICDKQSGQCDCEPGLRGRACDVCQTRHVLTPEGCTSCDDTCTGLLLDEIEALTAMLETPNITGIVPAPWPRLRALVNETEILGPRLESYKNAKKAAAQIVMSLPTGVSGLQDEMDELLQRSEEMKDKSGQVNDQTSISNDRAMDVEKLLMDTLAKLKDLINELEKLVDSLSSQPAMENEALLQEAQDILDEIMARDFSDQELAAEDELQSAKDALKKAKKKFMRKVEENKELTDRVNGTLMDLMMKFMELIEESQQSEKTSDDVIKQNDANNDMINNIQDKINEIKKNQGEIVGILDMGRQLLEDAADLLAEGYVALEETVVQAEGLKDSLPDLKNKVGLLQQNMIGLPELVVRAERHARELADFANYLEDLFQDTRDLAEIPVQAAEVYNDIVETLDDANKTAHEAKMLADEALKQASEGTGTEESLADRAMNSKARSESLVEGAEKKTDKVLELEDRLEDVKKDIDTIKSSSETIKTTNDAIKAELPNFDKELSQKAQDALQKARGASVAAAAAKQKTQDVVDLLPTQKQKFETLQDNTVNTNENMDIAERSLNRVQNALGQLQDLTDTMATKAAAIRQLQSLMANNLTEIKDKIEQARGQAKSIKVSVGSSATCIRAYRPEVSASFHNKIVINFKTTTADNLLLYIGSSETADDYMSMETIQGKVKFQWDVGAGIGSATHPLSVTDGQWYKAEAERNGRAGSLSVQLSTANTEPDIVIGQAPTGYTVLDIDSSSDLFIGGVPDNFENNALSVKLFSGCIGETLIDDSVVGLWNFKDSEGECSGCKESPRPSPTADTYQFDGTGHVIMPKIRNWNTETTELQLDFRSFDEDALLFYIAAEDKVRSVEKIVNNKCRVIVLPYEARRLSLNNEEVASGKSQGTLTGLTISTEMYIGGVPTGFDIRTGVSEKSFTGCMREFLVNRNAQEFGSQNIASLGVTDGCIKKAIRNVGIMGEGYVELPPVDLGKDGDITISFATYQPDALLLLAKSINNKRKRQVNLDASGVYYSIMLKNGRLQVQLNAGFGGVLLTTRKSDGTFNDGEFHVVSIVKEDNSVKISVDDTAFRGGKIPSGPNEISVNVLTIGGVRSEYKDKVGDAADVINAFSGCIQDIVINGIYKICLQLHHLRRLTWSLCTCISYLTTHSTEGPLQPPGRLFKY
ncbi:laminin subunit alpha-2-like, partial [Saccoglossus kowalevskii]